MTVTDWLYFLFQFEVLQQVRDGVMWLWYLISSETLLASSDQHDKVASNMSHLHWEEVYCTCCHHLNCWALAHTHWLLSWTGRIFHVAVNVPSVQRSLFYHTVGIYHKVQRVLGEIKHLISVHEVRLSLPNIYSWQLKEYSHKRWFTLRLSLRTFTPIHSIKLTATLKIPPLTCTFKVEFYRSIRFHFTWNWLSLGLSLSLSLNINLLPFGKKRLTLQKITLTR